MRKRLLFTPAVGQEGAGHISNAIAQGTIKHPALAVADNAWYTIVPSVLPTTSVENSTISGYTELTNRFNQQKDGENMLVNIITSGYTDPAIQNAQSAVETVSGAWSGKQYLAIKQDAWNRALAYYDTLS